MLKGAAKSSERNMETTHFRNNFSISPIKLKKIFLNQIVLILITPIIFFLTNGILRIIPIFLVAANLLILIGFILWIILKYRSTIEFKEKHEIILEKTRLTNSINAQTKTIRLSIERRKRIQIEIEMDIDRRKAKYANALSGILKKKKKYDLKEQKEMIAALQDEKIKNILGCSDSEVRNVLNQRQQVERGFRPTEPKFLDLDKRNQIIRKYDQFRKQLEIQKEFEDESLEIELKEITQKAVYAHQENDLMQENAAEFLDELTSNLEIINRQLNEFSEINFNVFLIAMIGSDQDKKIIPN